MPDYPEATEFKCIEAKFKHGSNTFRKDNVYQVEDFDDIGQPELQMFFKAGWVWVDGWGEPPQRDPNRKIVLNMENVKHLGQSQNVGGGNG